MKSTLALAALIVVVLVLVSLALARQGAIETAGKSQEMQATPEMGAPPGSARVSGEQEMNAATPMMSSHHMEMGPHMKMTDLRERRPGDQERAKWVVGEARQLMGKYQDYHTALNDGFKIFLPNIPQQQYHFTNYWYGFEAAFRFNPEHPTSLLYDKTAQGYRLVGVMYTAPAKFDEDELNERIPLSMAQWHEHVNFCFPPKGRESEMGQKDPKFGMAGSISTREVCDQAGGKFVPLLFGWMVHVYPNDEDVWGMGAGMKHEH